MIYRDIKTVPGIGEKTAEKLNKLGIQTVEDLFYTLPSRYEDGSKLYDFAHPDFDRPQTYRVRLLEKSGIRYLKKGLKMQRFLITDEKESAEMTLFNMAYMDRKLRVNDVYYIYGKPKYFRGKLQFSGVSIYFEREKQKALSIKPIYPLVEGIGQGSMKKYIQNALDRANLPRIVPDYLIHRYGLMKEDEAIRTLHRPKSMEEIYIARQSLVFSEFLCFQLAMGRFDEKRGKEGFVMEKNDLSDAILSNLDFELTEGQKEAWADIRRDMASPLRMERLIQGDVGSGKTILAFLAMARAVSSGYQALMMAPTEILAAQHYDQALDLFLPRGVRVELLTGSTKSSKRKEIIEHFESGLCDIVIGTHTLFQEGIRANRLGLTITDEQHRFGVLQRESLQEKQEKSDRLIMTATPIPRSLGIVMYGNTDISSIRTLPKGRKPVETTIVGEEGLEDSYRFIEQFLESGQQVYVVCPLIEDNPDLSLHAAETVYHFFKEKRFKSYGVGLLHGAQSPDEKAAVMEAFQNNRHQILVSTTVIEVGVNVVNANLLFVFDADRFGLATLHQLRGRVGRGSQKAYCILHSSSRSLKAQERLSILARSNDGFYIAEEDMKIRGGGDFFGTRQSGTVRFRVGDLFEDMEIMRYAKIESDAILKGGHLNALEEPSLLSGVEAYEKRIQGI